LLAGVVGLALVLRLWGPVLGEPIWHADEFSFVYWPLLFFDGDLNPDFFYYPHLQYYLLALVYGAFFLWQKWLGAGWSVAQSVAYYYFWAPEEMLRLARVASALMGAATAWWAACLARRVYGERAGLAAGLFCAVGPLHVRQSGLAAADVPMALWYAGAVWAAVRLLEREGWKDYALAGALVGLAAATKYQGALAGAAVAGAHLLARRPVLDLRPLGRGPAGRGPWSWRPNTPQRTTIWGWPMCTTCRSRTRPERTSRGCWSCNRNIRRPGRYGLSWRENERFMASSTWRTPTRTLPG
jgi:4-amino-4-deoxy-L-arabinose transferase-like glycosyltransferase